MSFSPPISVAHFPRLLKWRNMPMLLIVALGMARPTPPRLQVKVSSREFVEPPGTSASPLLGLHTVDETVPPTHDHRTLVLCFDGTGDQFDDDNSNVVNFFSMLRKDDPSQQLVYYQAGIGTYTIPQIAEPTMAKLYKAVDSMVGIHLNAHVMSGYEFLMENYQVGDKICIFGFSRGAYTARALAGMIHKVGLLPKSNHQQVPFAYKMYSREDETGWKQSTAFKKAFSIDVNIELVGVWDTVGSVGVIPKQLPFTASNYHINHFRHAIALDEHRIRFRPNFYIRTAEERGTRQGDMPRSRPQARHRKTLQDHEEEFDVQNSVERMTDVEEVWFAGTHCDVGGGAVANEVRHTLARIPLRWMIRQCFLLKTGILFYREAFQKVGMDPDMLYPIVRQRPPPITLPHPLVPFRQDSPDTINTLVEKSGRLTEEEEDLKDSLSPINDMLKISKSWWILELIPQKLRFQKDNDSWEMKISVNRGRGRMIPQQKKNGVKVHRSVKTRMEAVGFLNEPYVPRARWSVEPTWMD